MPETELEVIFDLLRGNGRKVYQVMARLTLHLKSAETFIDFNCFRAIHVFFLALNLLAISGEMKILTV
jgi:hypothetical protein